MPRENFSMKRMAILKLLQATDVHPTAEWVYAQLKPRYASLSLGTVYRNLKKLCDQGKAMSVGVINGQEHFDGCTESHSHFVCACCGAVIDVPGAPYQEAELEEISRRTGCQVQSASVLFRGVCASCSQSREEPLPAFEVRPETAR